jgi:hypothetical protein
VCWIEQHVESELDNVGHVFDALLVVYLDFVQHVG